jgi:spindle and centriole-associated protein 1
MVTTDEQLISLAQAIKNCPVINNSRQESQASERGATNRITVDNSGRCSLCYPRLSLNYLMALE